MKIDLLKDKGLLDAKEFQERVAPNLQSDTPVGRVQRDVKSAQPSTGKPQPPPIPPIADQPQQSVRGLFTVLGALAIIIVLGFLYKQGTLDPIIAELIPDKAAMDTTDTTDEQAGFPFSLDSLEALRIQDSLVTVLADSVLPQDVFEQLLPVPAEMAASGDNTRKSIRAETVTDPGKSPADRGEPIVQPIVEDSIEAVTSLAVSASENTVAAAVKMTSPVRKFTHLDSQIVTNQAMLKLAADLMSIVNQPGGQTQLYIDRNKLKLETNEGQQGVRETVLATIRHATDGKLEESVRSGRHTFTGNHAYVFEIPPTFVPHTGDIYFVLGKLVGPFDPYISQIITDIGGGINDNPVKIMVTGNHWIIRTILDHWSQLNTNFILNDLTVHQGVDNFELIANLTLIRYE